MEYTVEIKGMMCGHCEAHMKKALEAIPAVTEAVADHTSGCAHIKASAPVSADAVKAAVEGEGYEFVAMK